MMSLKQTAFAAVTIGQRRLGDGANHRAEHECRRSSFAECRALRRDFGQPQCQPTGAGNAALEPGANSFTQGQARRRIEDRGLHNVGQLHKDQSSIWQAEATKDGRRVRVGVDFRGNVVEENR